MYRKSLHRKSDRRIFRRTAEHLNSINVYDLIPRGGTRM